MWGAGPPATWAFAIFLASDMLFLRLFPGEFGVFALSQCAVHALRSVSISQVPQGYERGGCGVPTLYEKQKEHGSVPASRSAGNSLKLAVQRRSG